MVNVDGSFTEFKKIHAPFTGILSILKHNKNFLEGLNPKIFNSEDLIIMSQNINNAVGTLLHGLQDLGTLLDLVIRDKQKLNADLNNMGSFISTISNLIEVLNIFHSDTGYVLSQRGEIDY